MRKADFPLLKNSSIVYLDSTATTQKPSVVIDAVSTFYSSQNANVHRGIYTLSEEATILYDDAHKVVADFIGADAQEIVFTRGTTEGINLLGYAIKSIVAEGRNEVVISELEHHSNMVPWQQFCKRHGFTLKYIPVRSDFTLDYDSLKEVINGKTAIVAVNHISNAVGTINDVKKIVDCAKSVGALSIIDAAQSIAHLPIDVKELGCDFLAFSGHKMFGPTGIGVLYGRQELLTKMDPFHFGGDMIQRVSYSDASWNELPMKFEAGTPNVAGAVGLTAAVKYIQEIGFDTIRAHDEDLLAYVLEQLGNIGGVTVHNAGVEKSSAVVSFTLDNQHPHDTASLLNDDNVCVRAGHHCTMPLMHKFDLPGTVRASFSVYNTKEDVDKLVASVKKAYEVFASG